MTGPAHRRDRLHHQRRCHRKYRTPGDSRVRVLTPEMSKGLEFDFVILIDPDAFGTDTERAVDRYVAMTRATQKLVVLTTSR